MGGAGTKNRSIHSTDYNFTRLIDHGDKQELINCMYNEDFNLFHDLV